MQININTNKYLKELESIEDITSKERERIFKIPGVTGTALSINNVTGIDIDNGNNYQHQVIVYLEKNCPKLMKSSKIPDYINDIRVVKFPMGKCYAQAFQDILKLDKFRPIRGGAGIYNTRMPWPGTLGGFPIDNTTGEKVILSCNHVMALDWGCFRDGQKGDDILQPPYSFGGTKQDIIGNLERWLRVYGYWADEIDYENIIDGAIAKIKPGIEYSDTNICNYQINGWTDPIPGTFVKKAGAHSQCNQYPTFIHEPYIHSIDAKLSITFGGQDFVTGQPNEAIFKDQIILAGTFMSPASSWGDSGSLVVHSETNNVIGMIIAGSNASLPTWQHLPERPSIGDGDCIGVWHTVDGVQAGFSIANKIENLQNLLNVSFGNKYAATIPQPSHRECYMNGCDPLCLLIRTNNDNIPSTCDQDLDCENLRSTINMNIHPRKTSNDDGIKTGKVMFVEELGLPASEKIFSGPAVCDCYGNCTFNCYGIGRKLRMNWHPFGNCNDETIQECKGKTVAFDKMYINDILYPNEWSSNHMIEIDITASVMNIDVYFKLVDDQLIIQGRRNQVI